MMRFRFFIIEILALFVWAGPAWAVGVQDAIAPDPDDKPIAIRIWYPTESSDGSVIKGSALPLIVISHGTGGYMTGHVDTAVALAEVGFIVVAPNHTGDNALDQSYVGQGRHLIGRPRHISRVIDYMLTTWPEHGRIDPSRIGMFGHSAGGFTALVVAGGNPDMSRRVPHCQEHPDAWDCQRLKKHGLVLNGDTKQPPTVWDHDPRVKAAVIAAPCCGYTFAPDGLSAVHIPIQLWEAGKDSIVDDSPAIIRRLLPASPDDHIVADAGHLSFLAPCDWSMSAVMTVMSWFTDLNICADPKNFDRAAFHREFNTAVAAFLTANLPAQNH